MELTPQENGQSVQVPPLPVPRVRRITQTRIWAICFTIFCLEIGAFLTVFPWLQAWDLNHFPTIFPALLDLWADPYFRGAISGLGIVNLTIAGSQANNLLRNWR